MSFCHSPFPIGWNSKSFDHDFQGPYQSDQRLPLRTSLHSIPKPLYNTSSHTMLLSSNKHAFFSLHAMSHALFSNSNTVPFVPSYSFFKGYGKSLTISPILVVATIIPYPLCARHWPSDFSHLNLTALPVLLMRALRLRNVKFLS